MVYYVLVSSRIPRLNYEIKTIPVELTNTNVINITGDILYQKFRQKDVMSNSYETAHNLLNTTTNGYEFLLLLLCQVHTKLLIRPFATVNIQRFSSYKCIYKYTKGLEDYEHQHNLAHRKFDDFELCTIFLDHLGHHCFTKVKVSIINIIRTSSTIASEYLVPEISSTVDQLVTILLLSYIRQSHIHSFEDHPVHENEPYLTNMYPDVFGSPALNKLDDDHPHDLI